MFNSIQRIFAVAFAISAFAAGSLSAQVATADAAPFIGEWDVAVQDELGQPFRINVTADNGQVVVAITGAEGGNFTGQNVRKDGQNLLFNYTTTLQGQQIPVAIVLTPAADGLGGSIDLAGGMFAAPLKLTKRS
jgi:hypothetical protein